MSSVRMGIKVSGVPLLSLKEDLEQVPLRHNFSYPDVQFLARYYEDGKVEFDMRYGESDTWIPVGVAFGDGVVVEEVEI